MVYIMRVSALFLAMLVTSACAQQGKYVELNGERFSVEVADDREEQTLGLMFRRTMPEDHGMLFIFPTEEFRSFWMKNTRIPLDIMYFSSSLELVSWVTATPCRTDSCPLYPSKGPARYVLELNAGKASELDLKSGDRLSLFID